MRSSPVEARTWRTALIAAVREELQEWADGVQEEDFVFSTIEPVEELAQRLCVVRDDY